MNKTVTNSGAPEKAFGRPGPGPGPLPESSVPHLESKIPGWIDIHTHLDKLEEGVDAALEKATQSGVDKFITIGTEKGDLSRVLEIAKKNSSRVSCTLGIHPHHGAECDQEDLDFIRTHASEAQVVAVGEIGLDYYYKLSEPEKQRQSFNSLMELAQEVKLPVEIHSRDAESDTLEILRKFKGKVQGVIHCFTGSREFAFGALDCGYNISFSGIVTFKNADDLRATLKEIPLDRLHVETDSPYLSPVPVRGKPNTSQHIVHTGAFVARWKGLEETELRLQTYHNACRLFSKLSWEI